MRVWVNIFHSLISFNYNPVGWNDVHSWGGGGGVGGEEGGNIKNFTILQNKGVHSIFT